MGTPARVRPALKKKRVPRRPGLPLNAQRAPGRLRPGAATGAAAPTPEAQPEAPPVPAPAEDRQLSLAKPSTAEQRPMLS